MTEATRALSADVLGHALELARVGVVVTDAGGVITAASPRMSELLGRSDLVGLRAELLGLGDRGQRERRLRRPDGSERWIRIEREPLPGASPGHLITVAQHNGAADDARLDDFAGFARLGVCRLDLRRGTIAEANEALATIYGYEPAELIGAPWRQLAGPEQRGDTPLTGFDELARLIAAGELRTGEAERVVTRRDGRALHVRGAFAVTPDSGRPRYVTVVVQDVTELRAEEDRLRHQALHDALTGLANRARFHELIEEAAACSESERDMFAVLFVDLDHQFRLVNDALGHQAGDELLRAVAHRLNEAVFEPETVTRFGGDEFVVFCRDICRPSDAEEVGQRLLQSLRMPFTVSGRHVHVTASIGISVSATPDAERMLREADAAMYRAKALGSDRLAVFDPSLAERFSRELRLAAQIHEALSDEQFVLEYQPIVELSTGSISGLEALLRWEHPSEGRLGPSEFVPIAERTGMIASLGRWILRRACDDARRWLVSHPDVSVHVNVSPSQLTESLPAEVSDALSSSGIAPERLVIEVTEGAMIPDPSETDIPSALRQLGVAIALDDFGTGYSCLAFLDRLPLDELKVDREFVARLGDGGSGAAMVTTILQLAQTFGLRAVAEGIESRAQLDLLRRLGCELGQGFYFSRPVSTERIAELLEHPSWTV